MLKGMRKGTTIEEKQVIQRLAKTKKGDVLKFKVIEITDEYCLSELVELPLIKGKVICANVGTFGINAHEWFEMGEVFEGRVINKDINKTLIINPAMDLATIKRKQKEERVLEKFLNER